MKTLRRSQNLVPNFEQKNIFRVNKFNLRHYEQIEDSITLVQHFSNYKHLNLEFCNIKILFFSNFISNFGFFLKFAKNNNYQFIDTILYFRFFSSDLSNCIVLKFMCAKFQVSSSKKQGSY